MIRPVASREAENGAWEPAAPPKVDAQPAIEEQPDHTDDLYFKQVRNRKTGKSATPDPNQLDLFASDGT